MFYRGNPEAEEEMPGGGTAEEEARTEDAPDTPDLELPLKEEDSPLGPKLQTER